MQDSNFKDHFSQNSNLYANYRPSYPPQLTQALAQLCPRQNLALDCGCGTGQLSVLLADVFEHVIATDASEAQIRQAEAHPKITYKTALAEQSGLDTQSVDLITVAQAAHWLDLEKFYAEVIRITKPNAVLALITYGVLHVEGDDIDAFIQEFYYQTIYQYWPPERKHVEDGYQNLAFPFKELEFPKLNMQANWNLDELMGYFQTWSAVKEANKVLSKNPVEELREKLLTVWSNPQQTKTIRWPLSVRIAHITSAKQ